MDGALVHVAMLVFDVHNFWVYAVAQWDHRRLRLFSDIFLEIGIEVNVLITGQSYIGLARLGSLLHFLMQEQMVGGHGSAKSTPTLATSRLQLVSF